MHTLLTLALDSPELASTILQQPSPYKSYEQLLSSSKNPEDPVPLLVSSFLTKLVSISLIQSPKLPQRDEAALKALYTYLAKLVKSQDSGLQDIGVQQYSSLLRTSKSRETFWGLRAETVAPLIAILRAAAGAAKDSSSSSLWSGTTGARGADIGLGGGVGLQLLYHVLLAIWQLSFEASLIGEELDS